MLLRQSVRCGQVERALYVHDRVCVRFKEHAAVVACQIEAARFEEGAGECKALLPANIEVNLRFRIRNGTERRKQKQAEGCKQRP